MSVVRIAAMSDLDACVEIAGGDQGKARIAQAISGREHLFLVAEWAGTPVGFLIATLPKVEPVARIADFHVEMPALWPSVGQHLLREAMTRLKAEGIKQVVVTGDDVGKNTLLESEGLMLAEAGWTASV